MGEKGAEEAAEKLGTPDDLRKAMTSGNWSEVVDRQTRSTVDAATNGNGKPTGTPTVAADGSVVSPFTQASVHRKMGSTASQDGGRTCGWCG